MNYELIISRIFDPFLVGIMILITATGQSTLGQIDRVRYILITTIVTFGIPVFLLICAIKMKVVNDWDLRARHQRPKVLAVLLVLYGVNLVLTRFIGDEFLFRMMLFFLIGLIGFFLITLFWKISGHLMIVSLAGGLFIHWFGWSWWPLHLIIPLVGWARIKGKFHTPAQVIAGSIYSLLLVLVFQSFI